MSRTFSFKKWEAVVTGLLFIAAISLPSLWHFLKPDREVAAAEGRKLAEFPTMRKVKWKYVQKWPAKFEAWYNDHFGGRSDLLALGSFLKIHVFKTSPTKDVVIGKDGWLFFSGDGALENHLGLKRFTDAELRQWKDYLERRQAWLAKRGIQYVFLFTPDKQTIYPEFLPDRLAKLRDGTALDQLMAYLRQNCSVPVIDERENLLKAKSLGQLYWKTDTHWVSIGEYMGYTDLSAYLKPMYPAISQTGFFVGKEPGRLNKDPDLSRIMGLNDVREIIPRSDFANKMPLDNPPKFSPDVPLDSRTFSIEPPRPESSARVLVYHDSFFNGILRYFSPHFAKSTYVWRLEMRSPKQEQELLKLINEEKPGLFVEEMLERFILTPPAPDFIFDGQPADVALQAKTP